MPYLNRNTAVLLFFFTIVIFSQQLVADAPPDYQLMLMGGGVKTCSSMAQNSCIAGTDFPASAKVQAQFQLSDDAIEAVIDDPFQQLSTATKQWLPSILQALQRELGPSTLTFSELKQTWQQLDLEQAGHNHSGADLYKQLSSAELDFIIDQLEIMVADAEQPTNRLREKAALEQTDDAFSIGLYQRLVAEAKKYSDKENPLILLVTASSRDPFAAVDFYLDALEQAGATAQWLPIHGAYQQSQLTKQSVELACQDLEQHLALLHGSYNRAAVYPDLMVYQQKVCQQGSAYTLDLLDRADGIIFNGGDQSLTLQALRLPSGEATVELAKIQHRVAAGNLIVAGTSAGTAVMSGSEQQLVPMISNGDSAHALAYGAFASKPPERDCAQHQRCPDGIGELYLTYHAAGGAGLFPWGILDTHFSERGREGRLIQLAVATSTRFAFGVDEATALLISASSDDERVFFEVQGQGGVFIIDTSSATTNAAAELKAIHAVTTHYLTHGDQAELHDGELAVTFAAWKNAAVSNTSERLHSASILAGDHYQQLAKQLCKTNSNEATGTSQLAEHHFQLTITENTFSRQAFGYIPVSGEQVSYCSYQNVRVDISTTLLN